MSKRPHAIVAAIAAAIAVSLATSACSGETAGPGPAETSEPVESTAPEPTNEAAFLALDALTPTEFFAEPVSTRGEWCLFMSQDLPQIAKDWKAQSGNPLDALPVASASNTPQEKVQLSAWIERMAYVSHDNASLIFTKDQAYKMISCTFVDANSGPGQTALAAIDRAYAPENNGFGFPGAYLAQKGLLQMSEVTSFEEEVWGADGETSQFITLGGGSTHEYVSVHTRDAAGDDSIIYAVTN